MSGMNTALLMVAAISGWAICMYILVKWTSSTD